MILITTKRGHAGKTSVSYSGNVRYSGPARLPDLMNSWDFANYFNEANANAGQAAVFNDETLGRIQAFIAGEIPLYEGVDGKFRPQTTIANGNSWHFHQQANDNVDWYKTHYKWSWAQEHNINLNGGKENVQYYVSANYLDQNGNLRYGEDKYSRMNLNTKINAQPYKWLELEANVKYIHTNLDNPLYTDMGGLLYHDITRMWPMMPFQDPNGHYMRNGKLAQLTSGSRSVTKTDNIYLLGSLTFKPLKGWNIYAQAGYRMINSFVAQNLMPVYEYNVDGTRSALEYAAGYPAGSTEAWQYMRRDNHLTASLYSDYTLNLKGHNMNVMAGINIEDYNDRYMGISRPDFITVNVPEIGAATGEDKIEAASAYTGNNSGKTYPLGTTVSLGLNITF